MSKQHIIVKQPSPQELEELDVNNWAIWSHEAADFPWTYGATEACYFLEGKVTVIPDGGEAVDMGKGDFVSFPAGMDCRWIIHEAVRKHYQFSE